MRLKQQVKMLVATMAGLCVMILSAQPALAEECRLGEKDCVDTSILPGSWAGDGGVMQILGLILRILVYGLGAAATLGVIIAGIMYLTARDNQQQVAKAKTRLVEIAIGLVAWAALFTLLSWLIPGFNSSIIPS